MERTSRGWAVFDSDIPVLIYDILFGPARVNALAVGCDGGLIVVSPPYRARRDAFDDLERYGPVRGLAASNAFHHMGIPEWKRRFPGATVYAPAQSIARVARKTGLSGIRPISDANALTGGRVELTDMPYYRTGETLVRIKSSQGLAWYLTDIVFNVNDPLANPLFRLIFNAFYGPGLHYNRIAPLFMVRDKAALKRWLGRGISEGRPALAHRCARRHGDLAPPEAGLNLFRAS